METHNLNDIEQLNSLLCSELAAVETYTACINRLDDTTLRWRLLGLKSSHLTRALKLCARVYDLGGSPTRASSGTWRSFADLVEPGSKPIPKSAAIATLEQGEDGDHRRYLSGINNLSSAMRRFILDEILPEQIRTRVVLRALDAQP